MAECIASTRAGVSSYHIDPKEGEGKVSKTEEGVFVVRTPMYIPELLKK